MVAAGKFASTTVMSVCVHAFAADESNIGLPLVYKDQWCASRWQSW